jgi:hypothetical protein
MVAVKLQRQSGGLSELKKDHRLKGDPKLLGQLSFPDGNYLVATPVGYDSIKLTFLVPSAFLNYTRLSVVRSTYGNPINKHDGVTVFEYPASATPASQVVIDNNFGDGLTEGQWYYYTLFAKMPNAFPNWNVVDTDSAVVTRQLQHGQRLWNNLPGFYQQLDASTLQQVRLYTSGGQLRRFLDLLGYELDVMHTEAESLLDVNNPEYMQSLLLQLQGYDLSLNYEGSMGDARFRSLVGSAVTIRKLAGTLTGFSQYARALTDYNISLLPARNLLPSAAGSGGSNAPGVFWQMQAVGGGSTSSSQFGTWTGFGIPQPSTAGYQSQTWALSAVFNTSGSPTNINVNHIINNASFGWGAAGTSNPLPNDVLRSGIQIPKTGVTYTFSWLATTQQASFLRTIRVRFFWYDNQGLPISNFLQTTVSGTVALSSATPNRMEAISDTAPANAAYAAVLIDLSTPAPASFNWLVGGFMYELTSGENNTFLDTHAVEFNVIAQRVNLVQNPSAEVDNTLWSILNMTTFTALINAKATAGAKLFSIVHNGTGNPMMTTSSFMPINPTYVQSARFDAQVATTAVGINAIVTWYDNSATPALIRTDTLNFPAPLPTTLMRTYVFGNLVPPSNAAFAKLAIEFTGSVATNNHLVDSVLFGPGPPSFYFDGDTQDGLDTPTSVLFPNVASDFQWGGTQGKSTSYFYNNYFAAMKRLRADAPNWLPFSVQATFYTLVAP